MYLKEPGDLYSERKKYPKGTPMNTTIKLGANGLFGCQAINPERETRILHKNDLPERETKYKDVIITETFEGEDTHWFISKEYRDIPNSFVIASYITAMARFRLFLKFIELENKGLIPLYCDTDSVYYKDLEDIHIEDNTKELGDWTTDIHKFIDIRTCKVYQTDKSTKFKGKHNAQDLDTIFTTEQWRRPGTSAIEINKITKNCTLEYSKGIILDSGFTKPFII
jgi:hypothetical protein